MILWKVLTLTYIVSQATNQEAGSSDDFQDAGSVEKPPLKKKFVMDAALEDKLCDLYDIFVDVIKSSHIDSFHNIFF